MPQVPDTVEPVVLASMASRRKARRMRDTLAAAGIPAWIVEAEDVGHLPHPVGDRPEGWALVLDATQVPPARQVLGLGDAGDPLETDGEALRSPDALAAAARRLAFFSCLFPPLLVVTLSFVLRALRAARTQPPMAPRLFRRRLVRAVLLGVLLPAGIIIAALVLGLPRGP